MTSLGSPKSTKEGDATNGVVPEGAAAKTGGTALGSRGTAIGGTPAKAGDTVPGGAKSIGGTALGGATAKTGGTALGGGGTALGGASAKVTGSGAAAKTGGTALGSGGTALGGTPAKTVGTALGGTALGGAPAKTGGTALGSGGTALGGAPAKAMGGGGTALGGGAPAKTAGGAALGGGTALGGTPVKVSEGTALGISGGDSASGEAKATLGTSGGAEGEGGTASTSLKKKKKKKGKTAEDKSKEDAEDAAKTLTAAGAVKKGPGAAKRSKIAEMIKKQKEEEEKKKREEEERERIEEEKRKKEEEEEKLRSIKKEEDKKIKKELEKKRKAEAAVRRAEEQRRANLKRLGIDPGKVGNTSEPQPTKYTKKKSAKAVAAEKAVEQKKQDEVDKPFLGKVGDIQSEENAARKEEEDSWESHLEEDKEKETVASPENSALTENSVVSPTTIDVKNKGKEIETEQPVIKNLRSPICCVLGHVDTGKTSLLDKIRRTNVQGGEAGGITQQIGATYIPGTTLQDQTSSVAELFKLKYKIPGLLVIDTPGHESFANLRSRGSGLCDIAVLVVDIMHGIEPQTRESIELLRMRKTPFIVALNKIDRLYNWKSTADLPFQKTFANQIQPTKTDFEDRLKFTIANFAECGLNAELYFKNPDIQQYISLVPTSAVTGEGISDLLGLITKLTETKMAKRITEMSIFTATVLEVKVVEGHGYTIDVILINGVLREGDRIILCGLDKPIDTKIRALMTPHPLKEIRVKTPFQHHKEVKAAIGVKIAANGLEKAVAGSELLIVGTDDKESQVQSMKERVQGELTDMLKNLTFPGVSVQASSLGSLEALLVFLKKSNIPVAAISIGPIHKADVIRASVNLETNKPKEYACILAFDVQVEKNAQQEADRLGVKIYKADIIYHLFDQWEKFMKQVKDEKLKLNEDKIIFPCVLEILPDHIFARRNPIILGVKVKEGIAKIGTPMCVGVQETENKPWVVKAIGKIVSMEINHEIQMELPVGSEFALRIEGESEITFGRHFDETNLLYSVVTRDSINALRENCRDLLKSNAGLVDLLKRLKQMYGIYP